MGLYLAGVGLASVVLTLSKMLFSSEGGAQRVVHNCGASEAVEALQHQLLDCKLVSDFAEKAIVIVVLSASRHSRGLSPVFLMRDACAELLSDVLLQSRLSII